jgi:hypothetical protein
MDQRVETQRRGRNRNRTLERSKQERGLEKALRLGPLVRKERSYWSPYLKKFFHAATVERYKADLNCREGIYEAMGKTLVVLHLAAETPTRAQLLHLYTDVNAQLYRLRLIRYVPVPLHLIREIEKLGPVNDVIIKHLSQLVGITE